MADRRPKAQILYRHMKEKGSKESNLQTKRNLVVQKTHEAREQEPEPEPEPEKPLKYGENKLDIPLCYSFMDLEDLQAVDINHPRWPVLDSPRDENTKFSGHSLRLNNNGLKHVKCLPMLVERIFVDPLALAWLDLSFNCLTKIGMEIVQFENLHILYLHGNQIKELNEVDKLASLPKLRKLTLHGNPLEEVKDCNMYVTANLPQVKNISFSAVTKCQAATARSWKRMNSPHKKKRKGKKEDD